MPRKLCLQTGFRVTDNEHSFGRKNERTAYEATVSSLSDCGLWLRYEKECWIETMTV